MRELLREEEQRNETFYKKKGESVERMRNVSTSGYGSDETKRRRSQRRSDYAASEFRGRLPVFGKRCSVFARPASGGWLNDGGSAGRRKKERATRRWPRHTEPGPSSISLIRSPCRPPGFRNAKHPLLLARRNSLLRYPFNVLYRFPLLWPKKARGASYFLCSLLKAAIAMEIRVSFRR